MANQVDFLPFATGAGANVFDQPTYAARAEVATGMQAGTAISALANKTWRQSSFVSAAIANFIATNANVNVLDDGNLTEFIDNFGAALSSYIENYVTFQSFLSSNATFFLGGSGASDSNNGKTSGAPWATFAKAVSSIKEINNNGYGITVICNGPFGTGLNVSGPFPGGGPVTFSFSAGSSVAVSSGNAILAGYGANFNIEGQVSLSSSDNSLPGATGNAICAIANSTINVSGGPSLGTCAYAHVRCVDASYIQINDNYTVGGNAQYEWITDGGTIQIENNPTGTMVVVLVGGVSFTYFAASVNNGRLIIPSNKVSFSGSATGTRYTAYANGIINTGGGGGTFLPGTIAGVSSTGGEYL